MLITVTADSHGQALEAAVADLIRARPTESPANDRGIRTVYHCPNSAVELRVEINAQNQVLYHWLSIFDEIFEWTAVKGWRQIGGDARAKTHAAASRRLRFVAKRMQGDIGTNPLLRQLSSSMQSIIDERATAGERPPYAIPVRTIVVGVSILVAVSALSWALSAR